MKLTFTRIPCVLALILGAIFFSAVQFPLDAQINFAAGSQVKYLKGPDGASLPADWMQPGFDDSGWMDGTMPLRYGDGTGGTVLDDMMNSYPVVYLRSRFDASQVEQLDRLLMQIDYDDGFVLWINGQEVIRRNAPASMGHSDFATDLHESGSFESFAQDPEALNLVEGENTWAVQAFNISLESSDFLFNMGMQASLVAVVLDDTIGLAFSHASGFYDQPFSLEIQAANPAWKVLYTLDGSNPQTSPTALESEGVATVYIDPESSSGRATTPGVTVRASSYVEGLGASFPETRTFIYLSRVMTQDYPGGGWPDYNVNGQIIDLPMDRRVITDPAYSREIWDAMRDLPSLSIVTDLDHLFDQETGIYVNAWGHGFDWERECSVELLQPGDTAAFHVNAGLRIRGGWSRHNYFSKHSFRLFFRSDYGDAKLNYPLFGEEGTDRYDKIDLRSAQNYAWHRGDDRNTFLRDVFSRDTQGEMGQPYTRSRYYHLYLNGMYWGLFQTQERSEARFAADYLGGNTDEYDVIKVNTEDWNYQIEVTDGFMDSWEEVWDLSLQGFQRNADYFELEGKDSQGRPVAGSKVLVDIDNLIDYMMIIFYTGNFDAPTSSFGSNKGPNNFYAIYNREDPSRGFTFYAHDAEHSLFYEGADLGVDINEDRVNLARRTDGKDMEVSQFGSFHPQWLHHKLSMNREYRIRFIDRAYQLMEGNGILTEDRNLERLNRRAAEIQTAILGESARWGDSNSGEPLTRDEHWEPQVEEIRNMFFPNRGDILIDQLKVADLYTPMDPPRILREGVELWDDTIAGAAGLVLTLENTNGYGSLYYTLDGSDPREVGGSVSAEAKGFTSDSKSLELPASAVIRARVKHNSFWSAIREVKVLGSEDDYSTLALTELHYHPADLVLGVDTTSGKEYEFLEFKNIGDAALNLGGLRLDSGISYEFPHGTVLSPGQFYVVASKPSEFYRRYGLHASGNYKKHLSNGGEELRLEKADGTALMHFSYSDTIPWPMEPDGEGNSLVSVDPNPMGGNPAMHTYWRASSKIHGSPFADDLLLATEPVYFAQVDIQVYPNPSSGRIFVRWPDNRLPEQVGLQLYSLNGRLIYQVKDQQSASFELSHLGLDEGVYILRLDTPSQVFRKKIVIQY